MKYAINCDGAQLKRIFDILVTIFCLILLTPVIGMLYVVAKVKLGEPVFFIQPRPGINGKTFKLIKFRTMTNEIGGDGRLLSDDKRLGAFGKFLRSTSLDELPSLWNVLIGDMSLVGPRPLLEAYLPLYSEEQARRHEVRPGVTGWAQVNGRNAISWEEKFKLDVWYVDNLSLWLDIKILLLTIKKVLIRENISSGEHVTMPAFKGERGD